ncbi:hypothetical protein [Streptomyces cellulosae]|uniref:Uncharacterized protein n=1 Tax=Streptomyces cellulosae TaxID=1968 RepID=A0ABW7YI49_STRCE
MGVRLRSLSPPEICPPFSETGTDSYRLAATRARAEQVAAASDAD